MTARLLAAFHAWRVNRHADRAEARAYKADELLDWPIRAFGRAELAAIERQSLADDMSADLWRHWE